MTKNIKMKTTNKILIGLLIVILAISTATMIYIRAQITSATLIEGSGNTIQEQRQLDDYHKLEVRGNIRVNLIPGQTGYMVVTGDDNLLQYLYSEVNQDEVLKIYVSTLSGSYPYFEIDLYYESIVSINLEASARLRNQEPLIAEQLNLSVTSGAFTELIVNAIDTQVQAAAGSQVNLSGTTNTLNLESVAGSQVKAFNLQAQSAEVRTTAGAMAEVYANESIRAHANTGAVIRYKGDPPVKDVSSNTGGTVNPIGN